MRIDGRMLENARRQFCLDTNCPWDEYIKEPNKRIYLHKSQTLPGARISEGRDYFFHAIICLGQVFLMTDERIYAWAENFFEDIAPEWFCEFDILRRIDAKLKEYGREIADTHLFFLPSEALPRVFPAGNVRWYGQEEILKFRERNRFGSAICFSGTQPDVLAVAALKDGLEEEKDWEQENMAGMAGASCDGMYLWQIGINVAEGHGRKGLAANLTSLIRQEITDRGKTPFYGTSESHCVSQTVAIKAGFLPAWTEVYVRKGKENVAD